MKDVKTIFSTIGSFGAGSGKNSSNIQDSKGKSFGYQVLGFGSGGPTFANPIVATGGTITEVGNFKVHVFTGGGTFSVSCVPSCQPGNVDYIVVAGGGGGSRTGGGGGAGGFRYSNEFITDSLTSAASTGFPVSACTGYPISIGGGGAGSDQDNAESNPGSNSTLGPIASTGGGGAANFQTMNGRPGGSGGGGVIGTGGTGNAGGFPLPEGNAGGNGGPGTAQGGGGGGAAEAGDNYPSGTRNGGDGLYYPTASLCGASVGVSAPAGFYFAGGGAGSTPTGTGGGLGGGGQSSTENRPAPEAKGVDNTGGGGAKRANTGQNTQGGSGVVVIRYQFKG